jgi:hypothetical protein
MHVMADGLKDAVQLLRLYVASDERGYSSKIMSRVSKEGSDGHNSPSLLKEAEENFGKR